MKVLVLSDPTSKAGDHGSVRPGDGGRLAAPLAGGSQPAADAGACPGAPGLLGLMPTGGAGDAVLRTERGVRLPRERNAASTRTWAPSFCTAATPGLWRS
jgi:hypothetical protein